MADATLGTAVLRTSLDASGLKVGLNQARGETDRAVRDITQRLDSIGQGMQTLGRRMSLFITAPLTAIGAVGVKSAMQLETFAASLNVLIGDAERANRVFDELYEFSANTTFEWKSLMEGTRVLAAFGTEAEDIVPTLGRLGDIAAGLQTPIEDLAQIFGRVQVTGRLGMEEVNRLADRGVPIYTELARVLGTTEAGVRDLVSAGKVGFPELEAVIRNLTSEGGMFFGMMEAQTQTVEGRFMRLKDSFEQVTDIVGERLLPTFDRLINAGQRATDWFVNLDESTQGLFVGLGITLAASGPVLLGVGTLLVQIPKLVAGFQLLKTTMLPLLGPAGILLLVAGGVIAISEALSDPSGRGLDQALEDAGVAIDRFEAALAEAKGDMSDTRVIETLNDSFTSLGENLTGPVKRAFEGMRTELLLTVQEAENASAALTRIIIGGNLAQDLQQGGLWNARLSAGFRQAGALMFGEDRIIGADQDVQAALLRGDLEEALRIAREVERVLARAPQSGVIEGISDFVAHLEGVINRLEQPVSTNVNVGVTAPTPLETGSGYDALGIPKDGSTREVEVEVVVSDPAAAAKRWVERLEAELRFGLKGPREVIDLLSPRVEELRGEAAAALAEFGIDSQQYQDTVAKLDVVEGALDRIAGKSTVRLSLEPTAQVAEARPLGITPTATADLTGLRSVADIERDLAEARARVRAAGTTEARVEAQAVVFMLEEELKRVTTGVSLAIEPVARVLGEARELAIEPKAGLPGARPLGITPIATVGDFTTIELLEDQLADARRAVRTAASDEARHEAQLVVMELERELERLKRQVTPRELGIEPRVQLARPLGIEPTAQVAPARSVVPEVKAQIDGMDPAEWVQAQEDAAAAQRQAGFDFAQTVITAGQGFVSAIEAFQAGNVGGGISGLGGAVGGLFSGLGQLGGAFAGLGPWGAIISAGAGLLGGLVNLFGGGGQSDRERAEREQRRVGNVPAIELHFTVNQTNNYQGGPSQPENEQAFRRQANVLFEELYRRHLGPRLDRIEQRLGIAGAPA